MARHRSISIGENHRRAIAGTLGLLDEMLCRFDRWMREKPAEGILFREVDTLTGRQKRTIRGEMDAMRAVLRELRDDLDLERRTESTSVAVWSESSAFWEALVELGTKHLRRYGDMPEGFPEYFDPRVGRMIEHMRRIGDAASRRSVSGERHEPSSPDGTARSVPKDGPDDRR